MKPANVLAAVVLVVLVLFGFRFWGSQKSRPSVSDSARAAPAPSLAVVSVECSGRPIDSAKVTIANNGPEMEYAKAFVEFLNADGTVAAEGDGFLRPTTITTGARASATIYSRGTSTGRCRLAQVQDRDGKPIRTN